MRMLWSFQNMGTSPLLLVVYIWLVRLKIEPNASKNLLIRTDRPKAFNMEISFHSNSQNFSWSINLVPRPSYQERINTYYTDCTVHLKICFVKYFHNSQELWPARIDGNINFYDMSLHHYYPKIKWLWGWPWPWSYMLCSWLIGHGFKSNVRNIPFFHI